MTEYKNTMLISPKRVKESGDLSLNCQDDMIGASIRTAQKVYLTDILGKAMIEKLQELVYNKIKGLPDNIDDPDRVAYKELLDDYLTDALIYKTIYDLYLRSSLKIRNMGAVQNTDTNVLSVSLEDIKYMQSYTETMYNDALNKMAKFVCDNVEALPEIGEGKIKCGACGKTGKFANVNLWLN